MGSASLENILAKGPNKVPRVFIIEIRWLILLVWLFASISLSYAKGAGYRSSHSGSRGGGYSADPKDRQRGWKSIDYRRLSTRTRPNLNRAAVIGAVVASGY